jgi:hypothetical protein
MQGDTTMTRHIGTLPPDDDLSVARLRLCWELMSYRRKAMSAVDGCVRGLADLRPTLGPAAVDPLIRDYRAVLRFLASINGEAMPTQDQLDDYHRRMNDLQQRLQDLKEPLDCNRQSPHIVGASRRESATQPLPIFKGK